MSGEMMQIEYPTLRLNQQRLHEMVQQIYKNNEKQPQGSFYQLPELARCLYYLRDLHAADYLRQAAQKQAPSIEYKAARIDYEAERINWYRLAGDRATMQRLYLQLLYKTSKADNSDYVRYQWQIFAAHLWLGDDRECIQRYHHEASLQTIALAKILAQLTEARLTRNASQALAVAQRLAEAIREERLEPWSNLPLNLWDLYELSCQLLDPPLSIAAALIQATASPAQRLLELLQAQQIVALEWSVYNNNDEADEGYCLYYLADGTTQPLSTGFTNQELERLVWDVVNFD